MNESMIGEKNQPPGGLNPAFPSGASAAWETPAQQARRRAKEHQRLHGFASLLAAADALLSGGTTFPPDVRPALERLRDDPREQLAAEIEFVISEQPDLTHLAARELAEQRNPQLAAAAHRFYAADGIRLLEDLKPRSKGRDTWASAYAAATAAGRTDEQARAAADAAMAGQGANITTLTADEQEMARSLGLDVTITSRRALRAAFQRELQAEPELRRVVAARYKLPKGTSIDASPPSHDPPKTTSRMIRAS